MSFTLLSSHLFSRFVIISQAPHAESFSSFLRNDHLQACYVENYGIARNTQALSNGLLETFLLIQDRDLLD